MFWSSNVTILGFLRLRLVRPLALHSGAGRVPNVRLLLRLVSAERTSAPGPTQRMPPGRGHPTTRWLKKPKWTPNGRFWRLEWSSFYVFLCLSYCVISCHLDPSRILMFKLCKASRLEFLGRGWQHTIAQVTLRQQGTIKEPAEPK